MKIQLALTLALFLVQPVFAQESGGMSPHSAESLQKTQELLNDPAQRNKAVDASAEAKSADALVKQLTGDQKMTDEVYALAAEVFEQVVADSKGDPIRMRQAMEQFKKNPEAFVSHWTPEEKQKLRELSQKLSKPIIKN